MKSWNEIRQAATAFSKRWKDAYDEKSQVQSFLKEFFGVFAVDAVTVATRPLVFYNSNASPQYYTDDGNKNVSDLTDSTQSLTAHCSYAPFGALLSSSGSSSPANPFRFSSEFADDALGLVYYNYRHYNPEIGRWMQRDAAPIIDSPCRYAMCMNNLLLGFDLIGFWEATSESSSKGRRVYRKSAGDTKESLAKEVGLDIVSFDVWAKEELGPTGNETVRQPGDDYCYYSVPNIWITADLLRGGSWLYDRAIVNMGGTMGVMIGTDFTRFGYKIVKAETYDNLLDAIKNSNGDLLGMTVYAHGNKSGYVGPSIGINDFPGKTIQEKLVKYWSNNQMYLIRAIEEKKYRIRKVNMMQCYSMCTDGMFYHASKDGAFRYYLPDGNWFRFDYAQSLNWAQRWRSAAVESDGYEEYNVLGFDTAWISGLFSEREKE